MDEIKYESLLKYFSGPSPILKGVIYCMKEMTLIFRSAFSKHLNNCKRLKKNGSWRASKARVNIRKWPSNFFSFHKIPDILAFRLNSVWIILWLFSNKFMHSWMKKLTRYDFLKNFNVLLAYHWCRTSSYFLEYFFYFEVRGETISKFY